MCVIFIMLCYVTPSPTLYGWSILVEVIRETIHYIFWNKSNKLKRNNNILKKIQYIEKNRILWKNRSNTLKKKSNILEKIQYIKKNLV